MPILPPPGEPQPIARMDREEQFRVLYEAAMRWADLDKERSRLLFRLARKQRRVFVVKAAGR